MRKALIASLAVAAAALVARRDGDRRAPLGRGRGDPRLREGSLNLLDDGDAHGRRRQPGLPAVVRRRREEKPWKVSDPYTGKGYESAVAYAVAKQLGFAKAAGQVDVRARSTTRTARARSRSTSTSPRSRTRPSARRRSTSRTAYYFVNQAVVGRKGKPIAKVKSIAGLKQYKLGAQVGTTSYDVHHAAHQAVLDAARLRHERRGGAGAQERPDRRARRRPADRVLRHRGAGRRRHDRRPARRRGARRSASASCFQKGNPLDGVREQGARQPLGERDDQEAPAAPGSPRRRRARPEVAA